MNFHKYRSFLFFFLLTATPFKASLDQENKTSSQNLNANFSLKVTGNKLEGWGYQIYRGKKMLIDQSTIPAVGGNRKFMSEEDAKKVGELVLKKLSSNGLDLPSISVFELDSLKIKY